MSTTEEFSFSAKKLRELTTIAEGRIYTIEKKDLVKLFTKAGAVQSGDDKNIILKFNDRTLHVVMDTGRGCSTRISLDAEVKLMATDLLEHVLARTAQTPVIRWTTPEDVL